MFFWWGGGLQAGFWCRRHKADQRWQRLVTWNGKWHFTVKRPSFLFCLLHIAVVGASQKDDHTPILSLLLSLNYVPTSVNRLNALKMKCFVDDHNKMVVCGGFFKCNFNWSSLFFKQQIQHPTASLIAKVATAQDDITGDGTTSNVLIIGELLKQADLYISEVKHAYLTCDPPSLYIWNTALSDYPLLCP